MEGADNQKDFMYYENEIRKLDKELETLSIQ